MRHDENEPSAPPDLPARDGAPERQSLGGAERGSGDSEQRPADGGVEREGVPEEEEEAGIGTPAVPADRAGLVP